jgi:PadR family transcriptional regulator, regulatory protein PadR
MNKEILKGSLNLIILQLLNETDHYGYSLAEKIREESKQLLKAGEGTLYPALYKLENKGFIGSYWDKESKPARKYYFITKAGKKVLEIEKKDWKKFMGVMESFVVKFMQS